MEKSEISRSTIFRNNYKHQKEAAQKESQKEAAQRGSMKSWVKSSPFFIENNVSQKDRDEGVKKLDEDVRNIVRTFNERDEEER